MNIRVGRRLAILGIAAVTGLIGLPPATAVVQPGGQLVGDVAASRTPHVLDGEVFSVAQVAGRMVLGGNFTKARNDGATAELARQNLLAFDATTGQLSTSFVPQPDGVVNVVIPAPDGESVFVGGKFTSIGGQARKNLAQVRISDGAVLPFDAGKISGQVKDLRLANGRLWLAGQFTHVAGHNQVALATVDARSGAFLPFMNLTVGGIHSGGNTQVIKIDVTSAGDRLVAVGNFDTLQGVVRHQLFQLDISGDAARETTFNTRFFNSACATGFDTYMRDVDYSPDGRFFVVSTTGGYGGPESACDMTARFETYATGPTAPPSWVNYTGGDTTYGVEITDSVVYVGGHFRWQNNPNGKDAGAAGSVARAGIAALDPSNGLPYSWNPGRTRGIGVFDFLVTPTGLWVTSDTDRIGSGATQYKGRVARLPAGGTTFPAIRSGELPNDVYTVGSTAVTARSYRGGVAGAARAVPGLSASTVNGAFMINGWLYVAQSDGKLTRRTFDGTTFGPAVQVNTGDQIRADTTWSDDIRNTTGMFYENGRIYFTRSGTNELRYRYFTPESGVVGGKRMVASGNVTGLSFSSVRGMFFADGKLYWSDTAGALRSIDWRDNGPAGAPVAGTAALVSGPTVDRVSWSGRELFLFQDSQGRGAAMAPEASFTNACTSLRCDFDGTSTVTPGGSVTSWAWDFGDGSTGTGATPSHAYAAAGSYTVRLTVTSSRGDTSTTTKSIQVTRVNQRPTAVFTVSCQGMACSFDGGGSSDPDGALTHAWNFGDGAYGSGATPTHVYASEGTRPVTLTVTDTDGVAVSVTHDVTATLQRVDFVGAAAANANAGKHRVTVPAAVREGDLLVLHLALNTDVPITDPAGWSLLESHTDGGLVARSYSKRAAASDADSTVLVALGAAAKGDLSVVAYRGTGGRRAVVADHKGVIDTTRGDQHVSPRVTVPTGGGWVSTYWALKTSVEASWSGIGGQVARASSSGGGGGRVVATVSDSGGPVSAGPAGGLTGSTTVELARSIMFSTVIGLE
ncbi:PKD domain-containing protein [Nocardioides houyundeii]|uniref:PKD domain-containing protein n=1 Tax=Nocardioides houyundeii TaxID=2045452 RepID=UPI0013153A20|nr:PKD domain-containing protein [Nocardioides houyundeii]